MKKSKLYWKGVTSSFLFLLPGILLTLIFVIYPVIRTAVMSLQNWNGVANSPKTWVGLANYIAVLSSDKFWQTMLNSLYFMIGGFLILMPVAFGPGPWTGTFSGAEQHHFQAG